MDRVLRFPHNVARTAWFQFAATYYMWDMMTSIYEAYGFAFVVHGLLSFPVFLVSAIGPNQFLYGFYGRFYHGIFSLSTPWLHIRELIIAKKIKTPLKLGKHGSQVGTLRQTVLPAPLQRFNHRGGDPGFIGQITKTETHGFATASHQGTQIAGALHRRGFRI